METPRSFVSVKFSAVGRAHSFLLDQGEGGRDVTPGDRVVVQTQGGKALGRVIRTIPLVSERRQPAPGVADKVVRRANREDIAAKLQQERREQDALRVCMMKIRERGLPMKLSRVEQQFDGPKLIFYFTAEGRVDFRDLVRELASHFHTRIEMRQIGPRDEAKMLGGYGSCGRPLCCTTWLRSFEPVTIRMAKRQSLSLNPSKLSGQCGRLKCCLRYELPNGQGVVRGGCAHGDGSTTAGCTGCSGDQCGAGGCASCARAAMPSTRQ